VEKLGAGRGPSASRRLFIDALCRTT
jgi:hypothetical protein